MGDREKETAQTTHGICPHEGTASLGNGRAPSSPKSPPKAQDQQEGPGPAAAPGRGEDRAGPAAHGHAQCTKGPRTEVPPRPPEAGVGPRPPSLSAAGLACTQVGWVWRARQGGACGTFQRECTGQAGNGVFPEETVNPGADAAASVQRPGKGWCFSEAAAEVTGQRRAQPRPERPCSSFCTFQDRGVRATG